MNVSKIVTRTGDSGMTQVGKNRIPKSYAIVETLGEIDELSCVIGILRTSPKLPSYIEGWLREIQIDLYHIGSIINNKDLRFGSEALLRIEDKFNQLNYLQPKLTNFILPTGNDLQGAYAHYVRAVIRRVERSIVRLSLIENIDNNIFPYINRLSDLMFVIARHLNNDGADDDIIK